MTCRFAAPPGPRNRPWFASHGMRAASSMIAIAGMAWFVQRVLYRWQTSAGGENNCGSGFSRDASALADPAIRQSIPGRRKDSLTLVVRRGLPAQDFLQLAATAQANVLIIQAAIAHAGRGQRGFLRHLFLPIAHGSKVAIRWHCCHAAERRYWKSSMRLPVRRCKCVPRRHARGRGKRGYRRGKRRARRKPGIESLPRITPHPTSSIPSGTCAQVVGERVALTNAQRERRVRCIAPGQCVDPKVAPRVVERQFRIDQAQVPGEPIRITGE